MQRIIGFSVLVLFTAASCNQADVKPCGMSKEDSVKIAVYNKVFGSTPNKAIGSKRDVEIPIDRAQGCIDNFKTNFYDNPQIDFIKKAFSTDVDFSSNELGEWLKTLESTTDYDNMRIFFSVYNRDMERTYPSRAKEGRLTVILWPYKGNARAKLKDQTEEAKPFNLGGIHPTP